MVDARAAPDALPALAGKLALVEDVFHVLKAPVIAPEEGTLHERIAGLLERSHAWSRSRPTRRACRLIEAAERDPEVRHLHRPSVPNGA